MYISNKGKNKSCKDFLCFMFYCKNGLNMVLTISASRLATATSVAIFVTSNSSTLYSPNFMSVRTIKCRWHSVVYWSSSLIIFSNVCLENHLKTLYEVQWWSDCQFKHPRSSNYANFWECSNLLILFSMAWTSLMSNCVTMVRAIPPRPK